MRAQDAWWYVRQHDKTAMSVFLERYHEGVKTQVIVKYSHISGMVDGIENCADIAGIPTALLFSDDNIRDISDAPASSELEDSKMFIYNELLAVAEVGTFSIQCCFFKPEVPIPIDS